ncbi:type II secretion system protein [bacterium]|nr:type II secretion system protein [bacterium]
MKNKSLLTPPHNSNDLEVGRVVKHDKISKYNPLPGRGNVLGFTLAEVLITLVIIGVIAAITVPSLINKTNDQEIVSKLKKTYSTMAQATNLIIAEEGLPKGSDWASSQMNIFLNYKKHLNNARECEDSECFSQLWPSYNHPGLVLSDGVNIKFSGANNQCILSDTTLNDVCAHIWVDVNGAKKPNKIGRDIFSFVLKEKGLYPRGCDDEANCAGDGCACTVLRTGKLVR